MFWSWFVEFFNLANQQTYIESITTFYTGILAFMVPLGMQMILTIKNSYSTDEIEKRFKSEKVFIILPVLLLVEIGVILIISMIKTTNHAFLAIAYSLILVFLIITLVVIYLYIRKIIQYTNRKAVTKWLIDDFQKNVRESKDVDDSISFLKFITEVVITEMSKTSDRRFILSLLKDIEELSISFISQASFSSQILTKQEPKNILSLLISTLLADIKKNFSKTLAFRKKVHTFSPQEINENNKIYFETIMQGIGDITIKSMEMSEQNIIFKLKTTIYKILEVITESKNNGIYLDKFLAVHRRLFNYTIKANSKYEQHFFYEWYTNFVYVHKSFDPRHYFNRGYINQFDNQLFSYIRCIIDEERFTLFQDLIYWLHHGIGFRHLLNKNYDLSSIEFKESTKEEIIKASNIHELVKNTITMSDLSTALIALKSLKVELEKACLTKNEKDNMTLKLECFNAFIYRTFYFNNLKNMIFGILSYCIYKKKFTWVKLLWHFKELRDSSAIKTSYEIYPTSIDEVLGFIVSNVLDKKLISGTGRRFSFSEHHQKSALYEKKLEVYLLGYLISINKDTTFCLRKCETMELLAISEYARELKDIVEETYTPKNIKLFLDLGFNDIDEEHIVSLGSEITSLLTSLELACERQDIKP
ncbi:hypothetical protein BKH43_03495 [Helicobacter sp. 13S00401-1]|uniref:hypothetical protein n=1 Tax=Helicobacter sp. 13S00401-1 TaxID=1905758 RepID=UPI000BA7A576|nr:hypothetical protein [Helicobacter sp. 13S00401-1]PAF50932.1 hypothetical protein BKH43_03495 [Helicobacter sp. 13S00401-1]